MKTFLRCAVFSFVVAFVLTYFCYWPRKQTIVLQAGMARDEVRKAVNRPLGQHHSTDCVLGGWFPRPFGVDYDHWSYDDIEIGVTYWDNVAETVLLREAIYYRDPPSILERVQNWVEKQLP
jgi:hypothetical protein